MKTFILNILLGLFFVVSHGSNVPSSQSETAPVSTPTFAIPTSVTMTSDEAVSSTSSSSSSPYSSSSSISVTIESNKNELTISNSTSSSHVEQRIADDDHDDDDDNKNHRNCTQLIQKGACYKNTTYMAEHCATECYQHQQYLERVHVAYISEDKPSFFDLKAKNSTGTELNFRRFEGYVTLVITVARSCKDWRKIDGIYRGIEYLHHTWPYLLEIVVYFYNLPDVDYDIDCSSFHVRFTFKGRKIHVMEVVPINGPDTHPVLKYLKWSFNLSEDDGLLTDVTSFFIVNPDGNTIQHVKAMSFEKLKQRIQSTINSEYEEEEVDEEENVEDGYPDEYKEYKKKFKEYQQEGHEDEL